MIFTLQKRNPKFRDIKSFIMGSVVGRIVAAQSCSCLKQGPVNYLIG